MNSDKGIQAACAKDETGGMMGGHGYNLLDVVYEGGHAFRDITKLLLDLYAALNHACRSPRQSVTAPRFSQ